MSTSTSSGANGTAKAPQANHKKIIERIKDVTGASEDDITTMLLECNYDVNETTVRLIDNPFSQVQSKKSKRKGKKEEERKKDGSKIIEVRRPLAGSGGRGRGGRGGADRPGSVGFRPAPGPAPSRPVFSDVPHAPAQFPPSSEDMPPLEPAYAGPSPLRPAFVRDPGSQNPANGPDLGSRLAGSTMADLFKRPPPPPTAPPAITAPPAVAPGDKGIKAPMGPASPVTPAIDALPPDSPMSPAPAETMPPIGLSNTETSTVATLPCVAADEPVPAVCPEPAIPAEPVATSLTNQASPVLATDPVISEESVSTPTAVEIAPAPTASIVPQTTAPQLSSSLQSPASVDVPVSAPARPYQNSSVTGTAVWQSAGTGHSGLSPYMGAIGSSAPAPATVSSEDVLASVGMVPASVSVAVPDVATPPPKTSVILPPSAQVTETERLRLQFGQFNIGPDFSLTSSVSLDQQEVEQPPVAVSLVGGVTSQVAARDHAPQASAPLISSFKASSEYKATPDYSKASTDYASSAGRGYSAFSQVSMQPQKPEVASGVPSSVGETSTSQYTGYASSVPVGQNAHPAYGQYLSHQHSTSSHPYGAASAVAQPYQYEQTALDNHVAASAKPSHSAVTYEHNSYAASYVPSSMKPDYSTGKYGSHQSSVLPATVPNAVSLSEGIVSNSHPSSVQPQLPLPQAAAYGNPGMPPAINQYGHVGYQYPMYNAMAHSAYYGMPPTGYSLYPPQAPFAAPHQSTSSYHTNSSYPSHGAPASGPRFAPYSNPGSAVTGYGKDKDSLYVQPTQTQGMQSMQGAAQQVASVRGDSNPYSYGIPGQSYAGYSAHSNQYYNSMHTQYTPSPYSHMPQTGGVVQGGLASSHQPGSYKLQ